MYLRRVRDSNPRTPCEGYTLSRRAPSTTRPTLLYFLELANLTNREVLIKLLTVFYFILFFVIFKYDRKGIIKFDFPN